MQYHFVIKNIKCTISQNMGKSEIHSSNGNHKIGDVIHCNVNYGKAGVFKNAFNGNLN